jgi:hypothetical protein
MTAHLTSNDLAFLKEFKLKFNRIGLCINYDKEKNCFSWVKESIDGQTYNTQMIEAFTQDLENDTQTHQYDIYSIEHINYKHSAEMEKFWDQVFLDENKTSTQFKIRFVKLVSHNTQFDKLLTLSSFHDSDFVLDIFKLKKTYDKVTSYDTNKDIQTLVRYHEYLLQRNVSLEQVQESFLAHIKNNQIDIDDKVLIEIFMMIFPKENLPILYQTFNIQKENTVMSVEKNALSIINLSEKQLISIDMDYNSMMKFFQTIQKKKKTFPKIYCLDEVNGQVKIAFASGVENEAKISLLFEQMVAHQYTWPGDKKNIFSLMEQIHEKVHLETILNGDVVHKNIQKI